MICLFHFQPIFQLSAILVALQLSSSDDRGLEMDDPMYNLQATDSSHNDHLQTAIKFLDNDDPDLSIVKQDGETIDTWRSLICIYSSSVAKYLADLPCCSSTNISLPVSALAVRNLLKVLVDGVVKVDSLVKLNLPDVAEAAKLLGIDLENIYIGSDSDESYNMSIKTEPEIKQGKMKKKIKKSKEKKENKIKVKEEPEDLESEKLLEEDESVSQESVDMKSNTNDTAVELKPPKVILPKVNPTCSQCGKMFNDNYHLRRHMLSHTGEKPFGCDQCEKFYRSREGLKTHQRNVHMINFGDERSLGGESIPKPFVCDQCGKGYAKKESMKNHRRNQHTQPTGEIDYTCVQCGQQFEERQLLNKHIDSCGSSNDETQIMFNCNLCLKRFPEAKLVVEHLKEHQQEKEKAYLQDQVKEEMDSQSKKEMYLQADEKVDTQVYGQVESQVDQEMDQQD